jgi:hypothetical protein
VKTSSLHAELRGCGATRLTQEVRILEEERKRLMREVALKSELEVGTRTEHCAPAALALNGCVGT